MAGTDVTLAFTELRRLSTFAPLLSWFWSALRDGCYCGEREGRTGPNARWSDGPQHVSRSVLPELCAWKPPPQSSVNSQCSDEVAHGKVVGGAMNGQTARAVSTYKELTLQDAAARQPGPQWLGDVKVSVVVPALNEAENLPYVLPRIPSWVHEVLLVDGHSIDNTIDVARRLIPDIRIVQQAGKGKGAALRTGFAEATGDIIVMLDADGSTDPDEIPAFVGTLLAGADFAKGTRFSQGAGTHDMPLYRRLGNWVFVVLVRTLFGGRYSDLCYGYNAFWRRIVPSLDLSADGFEIETMMNIRALRANLKIAEVASFEAPRVFGEGRLQTIPDGWRVAKTIWREWWRPHRVSKP